MVLAFGLIGCSTYQNVIDKFKDPIVLKCPVYKVVGNMENLVRFRDGPGRDLIDVDFEGKITGVDLSCLSEIDRETKSGTLEVDVTLRMVASRGPANRNRKARFDYFFRVFDKKGNPLLFVAAPRITSTLYSLDCNPSHMLIILYMSTMTYPV